MDGLAAALAAIGDGLLHVDECGRVWKRVSRARKRRVVLPEPVRAENRAASGYLVVHLWLDGKQFLVAAHRLVWTVLRGPIPAGMQINHRDGDRANNHPSNLEVVTSSDNHRHAYRELNRRVSPVMPEPILAGVAPDVKRLRAQGLSFSAIAKQLGVCTTTAWRAAKL